MVSGVRVVRPGFRIGASSKVRFSGDGRRLATLGKRITLWDVGRRERVGIGPPLRHAYEADFSPDGTRVAAKNTLGDIVVFDAGSLEEVVRFNGRPYGEGAGARFSPCGRFLVDGSWSGHLVVRDLHDGSIVWCEHDEASGLYEVECARDRSVWVYRRGSDIFVRNWPFWEHESRLIARREGTLALSDDGSRLAIAGFATIEIWNVRAAGRSRRVASRDDLPSTGTGRAVAWHPTGDAVAHAGGQGATVYSGMLVTRFELPLRYPSDADFSPRGDLLALGDWSSGLVIQWPSENGLLAATP